MVSPAHSYATLIDDYLNNGDVHTAVSYMYKALKSARTPGVSCHIAILCISLGQTCLDDSDFQMSNFVSAQRVWVN